MGRNKNVDKETLWSQVSTTGHLHPQDRERKAWGLCYNRDTFKFFCWGGRHRGSLKVVSTEYTLPTGNMSPQPTIRVRGGLGTGMYVCSGVCIKVRYRCTLLVHTCIEKSILYIYTPTSLNYILYIHTSIRYIPAAAGRESRLPFQGSTLREK